MEDCSQSKIELFKEGSVISGTIMEVRPTEVVIDFGGKAEGTIPAHEFLDPSELEIGSDIEVFLERLEDRFGNPNFHLIKRSRRRMGENCKHLRRRFSNYWSRSFESQRWSCCQYWRRRFSSFLTS